MKILIMGLPGSGKTTLARIISQFKADYTVWMDTIKEGRFEDMNKKFKPPVKYDFRVTHKEADMWAFLIMQDIRDSK